LIECREALAFPGDPDRLILLRRIIARDRPARVHVVLDPAAAFGRARLRTARRDDAGIWHARVGELHLRWTGAADAEQQHHQLATTLLVPPGRHHNLVLEISTAPLRRPAPPADTLWSGTETAWGRAVPGLEDTVAPRDACHAYAVLRGLTSSGGGMVAAATMSLPERAEQGRNYDYRYVWIRDQCYAGQAVAAAGPHPLLDEAVRFVAERLDADGPDLKPAYTTVGGPVPDQRTLDLAGYPGGADILGNHVNKQFQLNAFGEALLLFAAAARHDRLGSDHLPAVKAAVAAVEDRWRRPDAGIWEIDDQRWAHSRLICSAGLRAMAVTEIGAAEGSACSALADSIVADAADCLHRSGRWQRSPGDRRVDAALLLPAIRGAVPAGDPRSVATYRAVIDELGEDGFVYRFRQDARPPAAAEGAFVLCGFIMALAAHQQDDASAIRWFERNRAACGPPGLFAEEYDVTQRQLRGNLPQAFVHAMLLECAGRLARPWRDAPG
jgi:GH15 family glucan-1,4-alpha-glucosidase